VQVDPIKPTLKAPGSMLLTLRLDVPLSKFALNFNLRRCIEEYRERLCKAGFGPYKGLNVPSSGWVAANMMTQLCTKAGAYTRPLFSST